LSEKKTSKQLLREVQANYYEEIREAKSRGEKIGYAQRSSPRKCLSAWTSSWSIQKTIPQPCPQRTEIKRSFT
jgi:hypothetical protein